MSQATRPARTETASAGALLAWVRGEGLRPRPPDDEEPLAADSWLVRDGLCRGLLLHRERFLAACQATGACIVDVAEFWTGAIACLPRDGNWFPRVEATPGHHGEPVELRLRLRTAPPAHGPVRLLVWSGPDTRKVPRLKGPDLARLAGLRTRLTGRPADELLLTTASGVVLETTNSSFLWWEGDELCFPAPSLRLLPGVTTQMIRRIALDTGVRTRPRRARVAQLHKHECWVVNALHGIRPVQCWVGPTIVAGPTRRAAAWQALLDSRAEPLPPLPDGEVADLTQSGARSEPSPRARRRQWPQRPGGWAG